MAQPQDENLPELRPEAAPLPFAELTDEQRSAGEKAAKLLRSMARSPGDALPKPSQKHSYLPPIDLSRTNRVILLDGARGSGKSALLVTLIDAYSRALTGEGVPAGYESWIRPEDRIVPVGLIDLQPLPDSTHLMLHLLSCLEHVVKALEPQQETNEAEGAAWHPGHGQERASRRLWRQLVRAVTVGWRGGLSERAGKLDPDALAVEVEEGELLRLDVGVAFRRFMDALVQDFQQWNHGPKGNAPLFLLSVDDADMNPKFCWELLELLRKLWHPRLAFLLTGDTQLFLDRPLALIEVEREIPIRKIMQEYAGKPESQEDKRVYAIKTAIYSKIIPKGHRCELPGLHPGARLKAGPALGEKIFSKLSVPGSSPQLSLNDLFRRNKQSQEALPATLRQIHEFKAYLTNGNVDDEAAIKNLTSPQVIEKLWQWVLENPYHPTTLPTDLIGLNEFGALRIDAAGVVEPAFSTITEIRITKDSTLIIGAPDRIKPSSALKVHDPASTEAQIGALLLATDYAAEASDAIITAQTPAPTGLHTPFFAYVLWKQPMGTIDIPWTVPDWLAFADFAELAHRWLGTLRSFQSELSGDVALLAYSFLSLILSTGSQRENIQLPEERPLDWVALAKNIADVVRLPVQNGRQKALAEWCFGRAGLLAAPESGLPPKDANAFLLALRGAFGEDWNRARDLLRRTRDERIHVSQSRDEDFAPSTSGFLEDMDRRFPRHQFIRTLSDQHQPQGNYDPTKNLLSDLKRISSPWLQEIKPGNSDQSGLAFYASRTRIDWLRGSPLIAETARSSIQRFNSTSGFAEKVIEGIWRDAADTANRNDLKDSIRASGGGLEFELNLKQTTQHAASSGLAANDFSLRLYQHRNVKIEAWSVIESTHEIIKPPNTDSMMETRALEAIFRIAFDYEVDRAWAETRSTNTPRRWWPGVKVILNNKHSLYPWPMPAWDTLYEQEELEILWNDVIKNTKLLLPSSPDEDDPRLVETLVSWFIRVCHGLNYRSSVGSNISWDKTDLDLLSLIDSSSGRRHSGRQQILDHWKNQFIVFAAPESGIPQAAASRILERFAVGMTWKKHKDFIEDKNPNKVIDKLIEGDFILNITKMNDILTNARKLRRVRMEDAGVPPEEVDTLLDEIDANFEDHPWVKLVGR